MATKYIKAAKTLEQTLWESADKLRKNMDAAEYKHIALGLLFLKHISDDFEALNKRLKAGQGDYAGADPEDPDEYRAENIFFVPPEARWSYLRRKAGDPAIGQIIERGMEAIEKDNPTLKELLPRGYNRPHLDPKCPGQLIELLSTIPHDSHEPGSDLLGRVYEYFLGEFAAAEGKKGGQFYTPTGIVKLLVEMLEPFSGRVYDPCCGSGGMFVQSEKFILAHQGRLDNISIWGQESNATTYCLCRMNLAIRGIDASNIAWNNEGSLLKDAHPTLDADYILANPPFNDSDWSGHLLQNDDRWKYGLPPKSNANFAWVQHIIHHLSPRGTAGMVLSNGSLSSEASNEGNIRRKLVEENMVDCIVGLPDRLFYNTGIPACLWFLTRDKSSKHPANSDHRNREKEILFIDAHRLGPLDNHKRRLLTAEDIALIAGIYHNWRNKGSDYLQYKDIPGLCKAATLDEVRKQNYLLTPSRYVGISPTKMEDQRTFQQKMLHHAKAFTILIERGEAVDRIIKAELEHLGIKP